MVAGGCRVANWEIFFFLQQGEYFFASRWLEYLQINGKCCYMASRVFVRDTDAVHCESDRYNADVWETQTVNVAFKF